MSDATAQAKAAATKARRQLGDSLDELEDKFNVPKRTGELVDKAKASYEENPVPWIVGAAAVGVVVIGLVAWAIFGSDD